MMNILFINIGSVVRKLTCMTLLLFVSVMSVAQNSSQAAPGSYYWKSNITLSACNLNGSAKNIDSGKLKATMTAKQLFTVIDKKIVDDQEYAIIRILNYNFKEQPGNFYEYNFSGSAAEYDEYIKTYPGSTHYGQYQRYFMIREADLSQNAVPYTYIGGALAGGVINFPFKLRLQKEANDFSSAFNLGAAFGYTLPHYSFRNFTYSLLFAAAIGNVNLDASSVTQNADKLTTTNDFSALTFALGALVQYDRFQTGVFLGFDRLGKLNNDTFNWRYQNKPWFSIGFGYAIFSVEKEAVNVAINQP
jgi:hypothetical protein